MNAKSNYERHDREDSRVKSLLRSSFVRLICFPRLGSRVIEGNI